MERGRMRIPEDVPSQYEFMSPIGECLYFSSAPTVCSSCCNAGLSLAAGVCMRESPLSPFPMADPHLTYLGQIAHVYSSTTSSVSRPWPSASPSHPSTSLAAVDGGYPRIGAHGAVWIRQIVPGVDARS